MNATYIFPRSDDQELSSRVMYGFTFTMAFQADFLRIQLHVTIYMFYTYPPNSTNNKNKPVTSDIVGGGEAVDQNINDIHFWEIFSVHVSLGSTSSKK